jgi:cell division protein FtsL
MCILPCALRRLEVQVDSVTPPLNIFQAEIKAYKPSSETTKQCLRLTTSSPQLRAVFVVVVVVVVVVVFLVHIYNHKHVYKVNAQDLCTCVYNSVV